MLEYLPEFLAVAIVAGATTFVVMVSRRERKLCRDTMQLMGEMILGYEKQLHNAMLLIKTTTAEEFTKAKADEGNFTLKVKYLEDALAQNTVDKKPEEPKFVTTTDGRKFDIKELEVL
jgi:hypothetical protein